MDHYLDFVGRCRLDALCGSKAGKRAKGQHNEVWQETDTSWVPTLIKTTIYKLWQKGECKRGDQCTYAHGETQLRSVPVALTERRLQGRMSGPIRTKDPQELEGS